MANYYNNPYGYTGYAPYYPNSATAMPSTYPQYQQPSFAWVQGIEAAKAFNVPAGGSMMLMDSEHPAYPETSYERGRSPMTGRYVSRDGRYNDSYDRGYSGHSIGDRAVDRLEKMMDDAGSEFERETIKRYISMIRNDKM